MSSTATKKELIGALRKAKKAIAAVEGSSTKTGGKKKAAKKPATKKPAKKSSTSTKKKSTRGPGRPKGSKNKK